MNGRTMLKGIVLWTVLSAWAACAPSDPKTAEYWIYRLDNEEQAEEAAAKLGEMKAKEAVEPLIAILKSKEKDSLRPAAAGALGKIGDPRAIAPLIEAIVVDPGTGQDEKTKNKIRVTERAVDALGELNAKEATDIILRLYKKSRDMSVRMAVARAMTGIRDPKFKPALIDILENDDNMFAKRAAAEAAGVFRDPDFIRPLIYAMYVEKGTSAYWQCAYSLAQIGPAAIPVLMETLESKNEAVEKLARTRNYILGGIHMKAIEQLGEFKAKEAEDLILKYWDFENEPVRPIMRVKIAFALANIGSKKAVPVLMKVANEPIAEMREYLVDALAELSDRAALPALLAAAKVGDDAAKKVAFVAYTRLGDARDLAAAQATAKGVPALEAELVRLEAAKECGENADCWIGKLKDANPKVRDRAAYALGRLGDKKAGAPLTALLDDQNPEARFAGIWALARTAGKGQLDKLKAVPVKETTVYNRGNEILRRLVLSLERGA